MSIRLHIQGTTENYSRSFLCKDSYIDKRI
jgi:hypothetical protein